MRKQQFMHQKHGMQSRTAVSEGSSTSNPKQFMDTVEVQASIDDLGYIEKIKEFEHSLQRSAEILKPQ